MMWLADGSWQAGGPGGAACALITFLLLGLLAAGLALWWFKGSGGDRRTGPGGWRGSANAGNRSAAEDVLAERYARGEMTDEEYWERLSVIREAQRGTR